MNKATAMQGGRGKYRLKLSAKCIIDPGSSSDGRFALLQMGAVMSRKRVSVSLSSPSFPLFSPSCSLQDLNLAMAMLS